MGRSDYLQHAILGLVVLSTLLASSGFILSLRNTSPPPPIAPAVATATTNTKEEKKENADDSDSGDEKDKDKDKDKEAIIDDAYKIIHQRYNRREYNWEDFDPLKDARTHEGVIFIVYRRHAEMSVTSARLMERIIEVHSENLKDVLRGCLKHIDTVFDPKPLLFTHESQLKEELEKLKVRLGIAEEVEKAQKGSEEKEKGEEKKDVKEENEEKPEENAEKSERLTNGNIDTKTKLVNGDSSIDNDSTAVNTPGSSTPLPNAVSTTPDQTDSTLEPTANDLRLQTQHLQKLLNFLETEFAPTRQKLHDLLENNDMKFGLLWCLFRLGSVVTFKDHDAGLTMAGEVCPPLRHSLTGRLQVQIICVEEISKSTLRCTSATSTTTAPPSTTPGNDCTPNLAEQTNSREIPFFKELRKIRSLTAQPLIDPDLKTTLQSRGRKFTQLKGTHYLEYHDSLYQRRSFGLESRILKFRAQGRAMVDCSSYQKMNPMSYLPDCDEEDKLDEVDEEELHFCAPTVLGYSFVTKMWGRLVADKFSEIEWNTRAFEHLVLPEGTKTLIKSLVNADRANADIIKDVITGKGGGCIVILHGRPGTGKTLTAEAIAEERQKPLMTISVGELGKDATELETKLTDILEISKLWEAVLLLDEADVFLEARSLHELHRNAMVGVFLRLLEYHQRVMFLTTNRVTTLDEAFKSRISIAIKYRDLDKVARRQVWENFLGLAGVKIVEAGKVNGYDESVSVITKEEVNKLASKKLNGREIKNTTRTAQALAWSERKPLGFDLLKQVLDVGEQFDKDFKEIDTSGMYAANGEGLRDHHRLYQ